MIRERMQDMNDYVDTARYASQQAGRMSPFLMGAIAGAAVALLFAPQPGRDSRHWLKEKADKLRHRNEGDDDDREFGGTGYETRSSGASTGEYGSTSSKGTSSMGTGTTAPKSPTSTNPIPTSPTGSARV